MLVLKPQCATTQHRKLRTICLSTNRQHLAWRNNSHKRRSVSHSTIAARCTTTQTIGSKVDWLITSIFDFDIFLTIIWCCVAGVWMRQDLKNLQRWLAWRFVRRSYLSFTSSCSKVLGKYPSPRRCRPACTLPDECTCKLVCGCTCFVNSHTRSLQRYIIPCDLLAIWHTWATLELCAICRGHCWVVVAHRRLGWCISL